MANGTDLLALLAGTSLFPLLGVPWGEPGVWNPARPGSPHSGRGSLTADNPRVVVFLSRPLPRSVASLPPSLWRCPQKVAIDSTLDSNWRLYYCSMSLQTGLHQNHVPEIKHGFLSTISIKITNCLSLAKVAAILYRRSKNWNSNFFFLT